MPGAVSPVSSGCATRGSLRRLTISLLLLVGAVFVLRSFQQVQSVDPGLGREPTAIETFLTPVTPVHARRPAPGRIGVLATTVSNGVNRCE